MHIKKIELKSFRRFSDLTINGLPNTIKLVVLAGPNGCGKSSLFDAFKTWHRAHASLGLQWQWEYHAKKSNGSSPNWNEAMKIEFHEPIASQPESRRKYFYIRTAYRNDAEFKLNLLQNMAPVLSEIGPAKMIEGNATVAVNYQRLASAAIQEVLGTEDPSLTIGEYRRKILGDIRNAMIGVFPDLIIHDLGNPLSEGTFRFSKGASNGFAYANLSGGEKAAFDLLLDFCVKRKEFDDTIFCIDEPEAHMNPRLQSKLLGELYNLIPDHSQLWVATHSIGMMRKAHELWKQNPEEVAFLDFDGVDFDEPQVVQPIMPSRSFWKRVLQVALDDMTELVAPSQVIICEGATTAHGGGKNAQHDAKCYNLIFATEFPDTQFFAAGNSEQIETDRLALLEALNSIVAGTEVVRLIDRDDHSNTDVQEKEAAGIKVLSRRHLESYLFDDEVLEALCESLKSRPLLKDVLSAKTSAIEQCIAQGKPADDIKSASGLIFSACKKILKIAQRGNDAKAFMRSTLAQLVKPGMAVYEELKISIFGPV